MTHQQKKRVFLYGLLVSAIHFSAVGFCHAIPTLLMRPEDMDAGGKPSWPRYPLGEALERIGYVLRVPFDWLWDGRLDKYAPDAVGFILMVLTSILWGFGLAFAIRFVLTHFRPRPAANAT